MKTIFNKLFFLAFGLLFGTPLFAVDQNIQATGMGRTYDEARNNAIRYALEVAFGTFVSTETKISNDILQKDETYGISFGHIKKVKEINKSKINDEYSVTLLVIVSPEKLVSFVRSKGMVVDYNGDDFANNIKVQLMNEKSETNSFNSLMQYAKLVLPNCFEYEINAGTPRNYMQDAWEIKVSLVLKANENLKTLVNHIQKTLGELSLNKQEIETRNAFGKYPYSLTFNGVSYKFRSNNSRIVMWNTFVTDELRKIIENVTVRMEAGRYSEDLKFSSNGWSGLNLKEIAVNTLKNPANNYDLSDICYVTIPWNMENNQFAKYSYDIIWKGPNAVNAISNLRGFKVVK
jgi:hypothetical protein